MIDLASTILTCPSVHGFGYRRRAAATLKRCPEREDIALLQFRTASGVSRTSTPMAALQGAQRDCRDARQHATGHSDPQVTECFGFQPRRSYRCAICRSATPSLCARNLLVFLRAVRSGAAPAVTGEEAVASLEIAARCFSRLRVQPWLRPPNEKARSARRRCLE